MKWKASMKIERNSHVDFGICVSVNSNLLVNSLFLRTSTVKNISSKLLLFISAKLLVM